jgi:hypothetical protein
MVSGGMSGIFAILLINLSNVLRRLEVVATLRRLNPPAAGF